MAKLTVIEGPDQGKEYGLESPESDSLIAGRDPRHPIALADQTVSRSHCKIERNGSSYRLVDLGSRNRTFLNGEPIQADLLRDGDVIAIGDSELRFEGEPLPLESQNSTIIKELPAREGESITRIIDSLRDDPVLRGERIHRAVEGLRELFRLSREILKTDSLERLYRKLLEILVPAVQADRGVILHPGSEGWVPRATFAPARAARPARRAGPDDPTDVAPLRPEEEDAGQLVLLSEGVVQRVASDKKAILSAHAASDQRFGEGASIVEGGISSIIAAPILIAGPEGPRVAAVLYADRRGGTPFEETELELLGASAEQAGEILAHLEVRQELVQANRTLIRSIVDRRQIVGESAAMEEVHAFIRKAAPTPLTVLIHGETGTGKELVAQAIHYQSARQSRPFVTINCAAIPESLIESELFGYEKGAFTSATTRKKGKFELADRGTIFLDELGELSPNCQAKLLRLLEEQRFERVGGTESIEVDVRIIAATNRDLPEAIEKGEFREDLFYRLNVLQVTLPPLRERPEDIPVLARHFLNCLGVPDDKKELGPEVVERLVGYSWPGNVRQLRNVIESAAVMGDGPVVTPADLVLPPARGQEDAGAGPTTTWQPISLEELQKDHIARVLEHTGGNKKKAAEILGIERCTLYSKLKNLKIQVADKK